MNLEVDLLKISDLSIGEVCKPCDDVKVLEKVLEKVDVGKGKNISLKVSKKIKVEEKAESVIENIVEKKDEEKTRGEKVSGRNCEHNKHRYYCIICTPSTFCDHKRRKTSCKECLTGNQICEHKNVRTECVDCGGGSTCPHKSKKRYCQICSPQSFCLHKKLTYRCRICNKGSGAYCIHEKRKEICVKCLGSSICIHLKVRDRCVLCKGSGICQHNVQKSSCKHCGNIVKCEHNIRKNKCKQCNRDKLCSHGNWSYRCKQCFGKNICVHWKHIGNCVECGKVEICVHNKRKEICIPCKGSRICAHNKLKHRCKECNGRALCKSEFCEMTKNQKYDDYCVHCYIHLFPDNPLSSNYRTKEQTVVHFVKEEFSELDWICDKKVYDGCSKRRPDMFLDLGYQVIIVEVDENQHKAYDCSCENMRLMEISKDIDHRPLIFIRFNPDTYYEGEKMIESCWGINKKGICTIKQKKKKEWEERLDTLRAIIEYWIDEENECEKTVEVIQLFYDC